MDTTATPSASGPQVPAGLDPKAYILTKAIAYQENGGKTPSYTVAGKSGEYGAYQFLPTTWDAAAAKYLGANAPKLQDATPDQQNQVAYSQVKDWLASGKTPAQVASMWNAGPGAPNAYKGNQGTNSSGVAYDTKAYASGVQKYAEMLYDGQTPGGSSQTGATDPSDPMGGKSFAETYGAATGDTGGQAGADGGPTFPASPTDSPLAAGLKAAGNLPASAYAFGKGALQAINPLAIASTISQIPGAFGQAVTANGGSVLKTLGSTLSAMPGEAYKLLVPQFGRDLIKGDLGAAQADVTNNPVGSIAPFVFGAKGVADLADSATGALAKSAMADYVANIGDKTAEGAAIPRGAGTNLGGALDAGMAKVASPVTSLGSKAAALIGKGADAAGGVARYAFGQATGLEPSTIRTIEQNPSVDFSTVNRGSLGDAVKTALDERISNLDETGDSYAEIRNSDAPVKVDAGFLADAIERATGLKLSEVEKEGTGYGKFAADADSSVESPADIAKVQRLYEQWQPKFDSGEITPGDFLKLRGRLAKLANFDAGVGKSSELEASSAGIRANLNAEFRDQIKGLEEKDSDFSSQKADLKNLRKGILDKNDELTDGAINKIANAAGKGKDQLLARLEEIAPGITGKIQILKAAEDLERAAGNKVGTYARSTGTIFGAGAGYVAGGPMAAIAGALAEMVLQNPSVATSIIKTYASMKPLLGAVAQAVRRGGGAINNAPAAPVIQAGSVFGRPQAALPGGQ